MVSDDKGEPDATEFLWRFRDVSHQAAIKNTVSHIGKLDNCITTPMLWPWLLLSAFSAFSCVILLSWLIICCLVQ